jgi:hypothetical protein
MTARLLTLDKGWYTTPPPLGQLHPRSRAKRVTSAARVDETLVQRQQSRVSVREIWGELTSHRRPGLRAVRNLVAVVHAGGVDAASTMLDLYLTEPSEMYARTARKVLEGLSVQVMVPLVSLYFQQDEILPGHLARLKQLHFCDAASIAGSGLWEAVFEQQTPQDLLAEYEDLLRQLQRPSP